MSELKFRQVVESDLDRCFDIEHNAYEGAEAATRERISKRILQYPEGFIVSELDGNVVGFINSGAAQHVDLSDVAFKDLIGHDAGGEHVVIFSVAIHRAYQHQGIAGRLMEHFIASMRNMNKATIQLICRDPLIGFYKKFGFDYIGTSASTHAGQQWHEMVLKL